MTAVRVAVVDDNPMVRLGVRTLLETSDRVAVVGEAGDGRSAVALADRERPDVVLLDARMPVADGLSVVGRLATSSRVVMLTAADDPGTIRAALRAGALGYLVYGAFEATDLVRAVLGTSAEAAFLSPGVAAVLLDLARTAPTPGHVPRGTLSPRESDVMALVVRGLPNRDVADRLGLGEKTVKNHVNSIFAKLGAHSRAHAVATWLGLGDGLGGRPDGGLSGGGPVPAGRP